MADTNTITQEDSLRDNLSQSEAPPEAEAETLNTASPLEADAAVPDIPASPEDIAVAARLSITATTLDGILTVKGQGREGR